MGLRPRGHQKGGKPKALKNRTISQTSNGHFCPRHPKGGVKCKDCFNAGRSNRAIRSVEKKVAKFATSAPQNPYMLPQKPLKVDLMLAKFDKADTDNDGTISFIELRTLLTEAGMSSMEAEKHASGYFLICDADKNWKVDFHSFMKEFTRMTSFKIIRALQSQLSGMIKANQQTGRPAPSLTKAQLGEVLIQQLGERVGKAQLEDCFESMDQDKTGTVTLDELLRWYATQERGLKKEQQKQARAQARGANAPNASANGLVYCARHNQNTYNPQSPCIGCLRLQQSENAMRGGVRRDADLAAQTNAVYGTTQYRGDFALGPVGDPNVPAAQNQGHLPSKKPPPPPPRPAAYTTQEQHALGVQDRGGFFLPPPSPPPRHHSGKGHPPPHMGKTLNTKGTGGRMKKHAAPTKPQPQQMAPPPHAQKQRQTPKAREEKRQFRSFDDFCQDEDNETNTHNGAGADDLLGPGKYPNPYAQAPVQASSSTRTFAKPAATPSFQGAVPDFMGLGSQVMSQAEMDSRGVLQRGGFFPPPPPPPPPAKHHQNALPRKNQGPKTHGKKK